MSAPGNPGKALAKDCDFPSWNGSEQLGPHHCGQEVLQAGEEEQDQRALPGVPPHHRGQHHLLPHHAHGDPVETNLGGKLGSVVFCLIMLVLQWHAGNMLCKVLMMVRTGGYILSSLMLVVLSIDR